jgi:hypothetical protein
MDIALSKLTWRCYAMTPMTNEASKDCQIGIVAEPLTADAVGCTTTSLAILAIVVSLFFLFSSYSGTRERALWVIEASAIVLAVNALVFYMRYRGGPRPKNARVLAMANGFVYSGDGAVLLERSTSASPATRGVKIDVAGLQSQQVTKPSELRLVLVCESMGAVPTKIVSASFFEGERLLGSLRKCDNGAMMWLVAGQTATMLNDNDREIFSAIPKVLDALSKLKATAVSLTLAIVLRRESEFGALLFAGALGVVVTAWSNYSNKKKLEQLISTGKFNDPKSGESILDFSKRLGFDIALDL